VVVLSDHGFHAYPLFFHPHSWLVQEGLAVRRAGFVPATMAAGPLALRREQEHRRMLDELDLGASRVLAGTCEGNYGGLRVNLKGREPLGCVEPGEAEALLVEIESRLRALRVPGTERPLVTRVLRGEALYPGPERDEIPDLIFETDGDVAVYNAPGARVLERLQRPLPDHDRAGILVAAGPSIAGIRERVDARIEDLAPTALHLLGLPVYEEMDGRALVELLELAREVVVVPEASQPFHAVDPWQGRESFTGDEREELQRRLRQLGYVE
jgi:predicted AlkP superfamily phosphohydrolase/phosphomutase